MGDFRNAFLKIKFFWLVKTWKLCTVWLLLTTKKIFKKLEVALILTLWKGKKKNAFEMLNAICSH